MTETQNTLVSFPFHVSSEVERLFDEMIHRLGDSAETSAAGSPLSISAKMASSSRPTFHPGGSHAMERSSGHFMRRMKLPESVDATQIRAEFCDRVLC